MSRTAARRTVIALTLGATAAVVVAVIGASLAAQLPGGAGESALFASRLLAAIAAVATAGGYVLAQMGRKRAGIATFAAGTAIVVAWIGFVATHVPDRPALVLLESDRGGLEEVTLDGQRWVAHHTLGFRFPQPEVALVPDEEIVRDTIARGGAGFADSHQLWAFATEDGALTVVIDLSRAERVERASLARLLDAISGPLRTAPEARDAQASEVEIRDGCGSASFGAAIGRRGRVDGRVLAFEDPRSHRAFHLAITIVGPESAQARVFLDAIVVPCG